MLSQLRLRGAFSYIDVTSVLRGLYSCSHWGSRRDATDPRPEIVTGQKNKLPVATGCLHEPKMCCRKHFGVHGRPLMVGIKSCITTSGKYLVFLSRHSITQLHPHHCSNTAQTNLRGGTSDKGLLYSKISSENRRLLRRIEARLPKLTKLADPFASARL